MRDINQLLINIIQILIKNQLLSVEELMVNKYVRQ